jgi:hypothetical protein
VTDLAEQARDTARALASLADRVRGWTTDGLGAPSAATLRILAVALDSHADGLRKALAPRGAHFIPGALTNPASDPREHIRRVDASGETCDCTYCLAEYNG